MCILKILKLERWKQKTKYQKANSNRCTDLFKIHKTLDIHFGNLNDKHIRQIIVKFIGFVKNCSEKMEVCLF